MASRDLCARRENVTENVKVHLRKEEPRSLLSLFDPKMFCLASQANVRQWHSIPMLKMVTENARVFFWRVL